MSDVRDMFTMPVVEELGEKLCGVFADFPKEQFIKTVFDDMWGGRGLFARLSHMAKTLGEMLPGDYKATIKILCSLVPACSGPQAMIFPQYIVENGMEDCEDSAEAMACITQYSSCEFAVRPFIDRYPIEMFGILKEWTQSNNEHVRRLVSEGTRLNIPWGSRLQTVNKKHDYAIPLLEALKDDPSEYVRKSVANNLNELSKVEPELVVGIGREWLSSGSKNTEKIIKHACRTLLKKGYPPAMELFELKKPDGISVKRIWCTATVRKNQDLSFSFDVINESSEGIKIRLGYAIGYLKSNGKVNFKEYRLSERVCTPGTITVERRHQIAETSTRKIYPGRHVLKITINGCTLAETEFDVQ